MKIVSLCLAYIAFVAGAELVVALVDPLWGLVFYYVILLALIIGSVILSQDTTQGWLIALNNRIMTNSGSSSWEDHFPRRMILALGLIPLFRIIGLSMPLAEFTQIYSYLLVSIPLLAGILVVATALNFEPKDIGITIRAVPLQLLIALAGVGLGLVDYFILKPEPLIHVFRWQEMIGPALILLFATGFVEELAFRGVMQRSTGILGSWGWVYIAALFAVLQIGQGSALHCLFALLVALLWGWTVKRTGSILGVVLSHGLLNIALYLIFPFIL
jgi:membrane protease YdiL (CAAX protease family)